MLGKTSGDQRDPFLIKQIEEAKAERNEERKTKEKYWNEINEIATFLGCYGSSKAIINHIRKYKQSHYDLESYRQRKQNPICFVSGISLAGEKGRHGKPTLLIRPLWRCKMAFEGFEIGSIIDRTYTKTVFELKLIKGYPNDKEKEVLDLCCKIVNSETGVVDGTTWQWENQEKMYVIITQNLNELKRSNYKSKMDNWLNELNKTFSEKINTVSKEMLATDL